MFSHNTHNTHNIHNTHKYPDGGDDTIHADQPAPRTKIPRKCRVCPKTFVKTEHLRRHERTHEKSKPFQCRTCGKSFGRRCVLMLYASIHPPLSNIPIIAIHYSATKEGIHHLNRWRKLDLTLLGISLNFPGLPRVMSLSRIRQVSKHSHRKAHPLCHHTLFILGIHIKEII